MNRLQKNLLQLWRALVILLMTPLHSRPTEVETTQGPAEELMERVYNTPDNITSDGIE